MHTHTHTQFCLYLSFVIKRKTTIHVKCTNKAFKQKVKVQFSLRPNTTLRPLVVVMLHRWRKQQQQHSLFQLAALCRGERERQRQRQQANKQNKCVFALFEVQQTNKTTKHNHWTLNRFFSCAVFRLLGQSQRPKPQRSHRPHIHRHTQTVARKQWLKNKTTATIEFIVVKALYAVFTTKQQQNVSIIMLCIFKEFDSSPNLTPSDR